MIHAEMRAPWVVLVILIVILAYLVRKRQRFLLRKRTRQPVGNGSGSPAQSEEEFPYIAPHLPPASEMFTTLQREKMETQKHRRRARSSDGMRLAATVYRRAEDFSRTDAIARHYTERLLVSTQPRNGMLSLTELWARPGERKIVQRAQAGSSPLERAIILQRRLRDRTTPVLDTHPALALFVIRHYCKTRHVNSFDVSVLDTGPGWGGQAIAACAACVGRYNALLLVSQSANDRLTGALRDILDTHRPIGSLGNNFWVRVMDFMQHGYDQRYDIIIVSPRDLVPLYETGKISASLRAGGWVVLFLPPGEEYAAAGQLALDITQDWDPPTTYRLELPGELHHALVWRKRTEVDKRPTSRDRPKIEAV